MIAEKVWPGGRRLPKQVGSAAAAVGRLAGPEDELDEDEDIILTEVGDHRQGFVVQAYDAPATDTVAQSL